MIGLYALVLYSIWLFYLGIDIDNNINETAMFKIFGAGDWDADRLRDAA